MDAHSSTLCVSGEGSRHCLAPASTSALEVWPSATTTSELTRGKLNNRHGIDKTVADLLDAATTTAEIVARGREAWDDDRLLRLAREAAMSRIGDAASKLPDNLQASMPSDPLRRAHSIAWCAIAVGSRPAKSQPTTAANAGMPRRMRRRSATGMFPSAAIPPFSELLRSQPIMPT